MVGVLALAPSAPALSDNAAAPTTTTTTTPTPVTTAPTNGLPVAGLSPDGKDLPYLGDPRVDPDLGGVSVDTLDFKLALAKYRTTERNLQNAKDTYNTAVASLNDLGAAQARLVGTLNQATRRKEKSETRLVAIRAALQGLAVDDYVRGGSAFDVDVSLDPGAVTDLRGQRVVVKTVRRRQLDDERANAAVVDEADRTIAATSAELDEVRARITSTTATRDQAVLDQQRFGSLVPADAKALADARLTGDVPGLDFSFVALDAYYKAAKRMAVEAPACRIKWTLVAAISRTEGHHGTFGGATLDPQGNETKPIIGIALDGSNNTAVVGDSDGGAFDGDPAFDRAVGPMQFLPSSWTRWGRDGNLDGKADPQNMYDSALAAAAYLCYFGPGLDTDDRMHAVLLHYNNSNDYASLVVDRAHGYDAYQLPKPPQH